MLMIVLMALMTGGGAVLADRVAVLRRSRWTLGLWFGFLAVVANTCSLVAVREFGIAIGLRDAPCIVAGLFFGPVPALVAGAIAAVERAITPLFGVGTANLCPLATFLTAAFSAAVGRWMLEGRKPRLVPAAVIGVYCEVLHLSFDCLFAFGRLARFVEIVYAAFLPEALGIAGALVICCIAFRCCGTLRQNLFSSLSGSMILFAAFLAMIAGFEIRYAKIQTDANLLRAIETFDTDIDDQIGYTLHCNALSIARGLDGKLDYPIGRMRELAMNYDVDELNIFDGNGYPISSTDESVLKGHLSRESPTARPFFTLLDGTSSFVEQRFRHGINNPEVVAKYVGVPVTGHKAFVQVGYTWSRLAREFATFYFPMIEALSVGSTGYFIVTDREGVLQFSPKGHPGSEGKTLSEIGLPPDVRAREEGAVFSARPFGACARCVRYKAVGQWRVYAVLPLVEAHAPAQILVFIVGFVLFAFCFVFRLVLLRFRHQQEKIDALRASEFGLARTIQTSSLPTDFPDDGVFKIFATMDTAREVGGDFYDFCRLPSGQWMFLVADVSGKGISAAMFMMKAKAIIRSCVSENNDLAAAIVEANNRLAEQNEAEMFVTAWIGVFYPSTLEVDYVSAGHNPPMIKRADGTVEWVKCRPSLALAAMPGAKYRVNSLQLRPGDSLFLYTDGVTEAMNGAGELFGEARLEKTLAGSDAEYVSRIRRELDAFVNGAEQSDDITMLALDLHSKTTRKDR